MKIIFLGTPQFSVRALESILESTHEVVGVVTQPDRINGRGNKLTFSKVKECAIKHNLPLYQFENISKEGEVLASLGADIMVTAAYGQILKENILNLCPKGIINVHASLLPKYRGSSPVQWSLINGDEEVGVTIMQTELGVDTGDIICKKSIKLSGDENSEETLELLSAVGAELIVTALDDIENGTAVFTKQVEEESTRCKMLKKEDGLIDFNLNAKQLHNFVRGMTPWPSAYTFCRYGRLKVLKTEICKEEYEGFPGEVLVSNHKQGLIVKCKNGAIKILEVQGENAKAMDIYSYLSGKAIEAGSKLGE